MTGKCFVHFFDLPVDRFHGLLFTHLFESSIPARLPHVQTLDEKPNVAPLEGALGFLLEECIPNVNEELLEKRLDLLFLCFRHPGRIGEILDP